MNESYPFLFNSCLFFLSFVLLVFPTLLMGATLPVLSRFFVRSFAQFGRRVGDLYATNTLGAVIGCAAGGFFLIPTLGMRTTVFVAAGVNLVIALVILSSTVYAIEPAAGKLPQSRRRKRPQKALSRRRRAPLSRLGVARFVRAVRIRLAGLRKRLDALAHAGDRQLDLFVLDHARDFSHRSGAGRIYLRASSRRRRRA